jgi:hypothetical protein
MLCVTISLLWHLQNPLHPILVLPSLHTIIFYCLFKNNFSIYAKVSEALSYIKQYLTSSSILHRALSYMSGILHRAVAYIKRYLTSSGILHRAISYIKVFKSKFYINLSSPRIRAICQTHLSFLNCKHPNYYRWNLFISMCYELFRINRLLDFGHHLIMGKNTGFGTKAWQHLR